MLKMQCNALKKALSLVPSLAAFGTSHFIAAPPSTGIPIGRAPRPGRSPLAAWRGKYSPLGFPLLGIRRWRREGPLHGRNTGLTYKLDEAKKIHLR